MKTSVHTVFRKCKINGDPAKFEALLKTLKLRQAMPDIREMVESVDYLKKRISG